VSAHRLPSCYRNSLELAAQKAARSVAFPASSTGVYDFPLERATRIAVREVLQFLAGHPAMGKILFVCFDRQTFECYQKVLQEVGGPTVGMDNR
jgi:O-acetyl-ADP-ribose deacetylase (regulator of RNase III)